jgi:hypothetical protein
MIEKLQELGLSKNECKLYIKLANQKSATANDLAKSAGINRTVTYNLLQSLQNCLAQTKLTMTATEWLIAMILTVATILLAMAREIAMI